MRKAVAKEKEETFSKSEVRAELIQSIDLWLNESNLKLEEQKNFLIFDWRYEDCRIDSRKYFSMAQAVFLVGTNMGLLTYEDYPVFRSDNGG